MHWLQRYCKFSWCCPAKERCKSRRQKTKLCYTRNYFRQGGDIGTTDCTIWPGLIARWLCEKDASYKTGNDDLAKTLRTDFMERLKTHDITFSACHFNTSVPTLRLTANSAQGNKERKRRDTTRIRHVPMKALFFFFFFLLSKGEIKLSFKESHQGRPEKRSSESELAMCHIDEAHGCLRTAIVSTENGLARKLLGVMLLWPPRSNEENRTAKHPLIKWWDAEFILAFIKRAPLFSIYQPPCKGKNGAYFVGSKMQLGCHVISGILGWNARDISRKAKR